VDGLSAPSHYAAAFSSPSRAFAGHVSFHTAAAIGVCLSARSLSIKLNECLEAGRSSERSEHERTVLQMLTVFPCIGAQRATWSMARKIDRSLSIDDETSLNSNRANFPLKS
jgi:hypothetical protein